MRDKNLVLAIAIDIAHGKAVVFAKTAIEPCQLSSMSVKYQHLVIHIVSDQDLIHFVAHDITDRKSIVFCEITTDLILPPSISMRPPVFVVIHLHFQTIIVVGARNENLTALTIIRNVTHSKAIVFSKVSITEPSYLIPLFIK